MKTSYKWLQDYVDIETPPEQLADDLTMAGLEVEGIETIGELASSIVVAEILERSPHPDADKLSVCTVNDGSDESVQIVCGAPNCDAGKKVALARIGTTFGDFTIKKAKLRGVPSFGMLCSEKELGLSNEADGIMELSSDAPVGTPLSDYLESDTVIDWEVTPNRGDWLSHIGISREICAMTGAELAMPDAQLTESGGDVNDHISIQVDDAELCPRYTGRVIKNVKIGPSPAWMQERLTAIGLRPINNVVDITNYVLMECGQPLHAFDLDLIRGKKIIVRRANNGETIQTLDDQSHELSPENLLIADTEGGIALAGVMGGANSEIHEGSVNVMLESAAFHAPNIRKTSRSLGIISDSSYRFERGTDYNMVEFASSRAAKLICDIAGGELVTGMIDVTAGAYVAPTITARFRRINDLIGIEVPKDAIRQLMKGLGLDTVTETEDEITLSIPSWRHDLVREVDLIEEIARLYGFDKIPAAIPGGKVGGAIHTDDYYKQESLRDAILGLGLDECVHVGPINADDAKSAGFPESNLVEISNPLSLEYGVLRPGVLPSMLRTVAGNIAHGNNELKLFEIGRAFNSIDDSVKENYECCIALTGTKHPERFSSELETDYDFYDLSGLIFDIFAAAGIAEPTLSAATYPAFEDGICADILFNGRSIGQLGQVKSALTKDMRIRHSLYIAVINIDPIIRKMGKDHQYNSLSQFPSTARDVAFVAGDSLPHNDVLKVINSCKVKILEGVHLFDIFEDEKAIGPGKKSMAYSLTFRAQDRTLKDKEVNKAHDYIKSELVKKLGVEIR